MTSFVVRRLLQAVPTLLGITVLSFVLMHAAPGDPVQLFTFGVTELKPEDVAGLRHQMGLDRPLPVQYGYWLARLARFDFGRSFKTSEPVSLLIFERLGNTLILTGCALLVAMAGGIPLGLVAALNRGGLLDHIARVFAVLGNAMPNFWQGLMLIMVFAVWLSWLPVGGMYTIGGEDGNLLDRLRHLIMPVLVLSGGGMATFSRLMRTELLEVLRQEYIRTAHAKGLPLSAVVSRHMLKNALIPLVTVLGGTLATLFGGAVVTEVVFSWPGMGRLAVDSAFQKDYPVLMGIVVIGAALVLLGYLLSDVAYAWVDPRIRYR